MSSPVYPRTLFKTITLATNAEKEKVIRVKFPFNQEDVNNIRTIIGRQWHKKEECWSVPLSFSNVKTLIGWGFKPNEKLVEYVQSAQQEINNKIHVPGLKAELFPYQKEFVAFAEKHKGAVLNADDMGLGKTLEAIAWLHLHQEIRPILIITPASLKLNWKKEYEKWTDETSIQVLEGTKPYPITSKVVIINYDIVKNWMLKLIKHGFKMMILDEAHLIKNNSTLRTKAIKKIRKSIPTLMALTGTPVESKPIDIYNAISLINPTIFPSYWDFVWKYCNPKNNGFGWDFTGSKNVAELHQKLVGTVMIRRLKKDVLPQLPEKIRSFIPIEIDNKPEYIKAENDFIRYLDEQKGIVATEKMKKAEHLIKIEGLKQIAVKGKLKSTIDWIKNFLETEDKLVVVTSHGFALDVIYAAFPGISVKLDGSVTGEKRQKVVEDFQTKPNINLFIMNLQAGGVGITLTAACNELIVELGWNPKQMDQVEDRVHRLTTTRGVNIYYALAAGTIEEKIAKILDAKRKVVDAVLDNVETESGSLLHELMKEYSKK